MRFLGHVHGHVRALDERIDVIAVVGEERDADRGLDVEREALEHERTREGRGDLAGHAQGRVRICSSGQKHGELVATETGNRVDIAQHAAEARPDRLQDQIAVSMPERIVDLLEPIEIHDQERETGVLAARLQDRLLDAIAE